MNIILGQGMQPISIGARYWRGDQDECFVDLNIGESIMVNMPNLAFPDNDPLALVTVGLEARTSDGQVEFYIDVSSDATESTERVYSNLIETDPEA